MGGRPTFVGLIALAIAMGGVGTFAAPQSALAEIRVPLPGSDKKKVKRRRFVRPSRPSRNPTRVFAGVSAAAISLEAADNSEAVAVAGTSSSAGVALALPAPARTKKNEIGPDAAYAEDAVATDNSSADDDALDETAQDDASDDNSVSGTQDVAGADGADGDAPSAANAKDEIDPVETAEASSEIDKTKAESSTDADGDPASVAQKSDEVEEQQDDAAGAAGAGKEEADEDTASIETEASDARDDPSPDTETTGTETAETEPARQTDEATEELVATAALEASEAAALQETDASEPERSSKSEDSELETADKPETEFPEAVRSPDGPSVVLRVLPPPEAVLNASEPTGNVADTLAPAAAAKDKEERDDETKVASLTPPNAPAADSVDAPAANAADEAETDNSDAGGEADESGVPSAESAPPAEDEAEAGEAGQDTIEQDTTAEDATPEDATADEKVAAEDMDSDTSTAGEESSDADDPNADAVIAVPEPPPPPAHPVIAVVREKLEEPEAFKSVAASDLTALKDFYGAYEEAPLWIADTGFSSKVKTIKATIEKADDWGLAASSFDLPDADAALATEDAQADAEIALSIAILSYARDAQIGRLSPSKVSKLFDQHPKLRDPKTVLTEIGGSDRPGEYLVSLHPQHTQFRRLQQALVWARDSARVTGRDPKRDRNVQLITMNMERWRWLPRQLGNYYVWNNVPEFEVSVIKGGQSIYRERTIVGQHKYATPFFSAPMRNIVFHPNWTVPPTIVKEDIAPKLKGPRGGGFFGQSKKNLLRRYGLAVSYKGEPIDADTVDWNNVNVHKYTFTQDSGPANVLGQFKFNFPNKHAIYMHDTVQRELFSQRQRTLSHGCIRVHQPDRLAALLLGEDKNWSLNQVRSLVARNDTKVVSFNKRVPVHLTYFTATVDENGTVRDFTDIYGIDNRMAPMLFTTPEYFPAPAPSPTVETSRNTRPAQNRRRRPSNNGLDNFLTGLFGN